MHASTLAALAFVIATVSGCGVLGKNEVPDAQKPARTVAVRLNADARLNTDARGRPLALVARIYKLRQAAAFEAAPYAAFLSPQDEQAAFGPDLLEVKEVTLVPGQHYEVAEKVSREAGFIGVVALFHRPAPQRWRLAYAAPEAEASGMTVGLSGCALRAAGGAPARGPLAALPAPARCQ